MHLIEFKGRNISKNFNLNLLFQENKTYIMDNHLAASWCWLKQINLDKKYSLFHIDRHYDLLNSQTSLWLQTIERMGIDLATITIDELLAIQYHNPQWATTESIQLFSYDNYLTILLRLYPKLINAKWFATHKDGDRIKYLRMKEPKIYELQDNLSFWINENPEQKWIINLDIDYFFSDKGEIRFQFLTDDYVMKIAEEIRASWEKIEVLTIALSPEFCGGWENAERVARIITDSLHINWEIPKNKIKN